MQSPNDRLTIFDVVCKLSWPDFVIFCRKLLWACLGPLWKLKRKLKLHWELLALQSDILLVCFSKILLNKLSNFANVYVTENIAYQFLKREKVKLQELFNLKRYILPIFQFEEIAQQIFKFYSRLSGVTQTSANYCLAVLSNIGILPRQTSLKFVIWDVFHKL